MKKLSSAFVKQTIEDYLNRNSAKLSKESVEKNIKSKIDTFFETKAVLGFDIYRYSRYPLLEQTLIPHLFKELYKITIDNCIKHEPFIFQNIEKENFSENFIDTGDGGFQIFDDPFQAIVFSIYFQANTKRYNSGVFPENLQKIIGDITLRYCLTHDTIYCYENNFYGSAIINNARIMAKDKLNRFLVDDNTVAWFSQEFNGIENLQTINFEDDFSKINIFKTIKKDLKIKEQTVLFDNKKSKILKVDVLRIGEIKSKLDILSVHSLHIQTLMIARTKSGFNKFTISVGNLNSTGISDE